MHIVHVYIQVKEEDIDAFITVTMDNAGNSIHETGVLRFDVVQQSDDPTRFVLIEIYKTPEDNARHRETPHFARWQKTVENMLVAPRTRVFYNDVFTSDKSW